MSKYKLAQLTKLERTLNVERNIQEMQCSENNAGPTRRADKAPCCTSVNNVVDCFRYARTYLPRSQVKSQKRYISSEE